MPVYRHTARYAPLHPEIVKRLIPYVERVRAEHGDGPLFRHLPKDKNGKRSIYVARKIDEWMEGVIKDHPDDVDVYIYDLSYHEPFSQ